MESTNEETHFDQMQPDTEKRVSTFENEPEIIPNMESGDAQGIIRETVTIMNNNVQVLYERGENLDQLIRGAEDLEEQAEYFSQESHRATTKFRWKVQLILIFILAAFIFVIISIIFSLL